MWACFKFNMCLRNMAFKHRTTKPFKSLSRDSILLLTKKLKSRRAGILIFIKKNIFYKIQKDVSESDEREK